MHRESRRGPGVRRGVARRGGRWRIPGSRRGGEGDAACAARSSNPTPRFTPRTKSHISAFAGLMARRVRVQFRGCENSPRECTPSPAECALPLRRIVGSQETGLVVVLALVTITLTLLAGSHVDRASGVSVNNFWNSHTLIQTATDASFFAIMAIGATVVIISGGIDLSVGSIYALSGVTMALVLRSARPDERRRDGLHGARCVRGRRTGLRPVERHRSSWGFACIRSSSRSARCGCCAASRSSRRRPRASSCRRRSPR